MYTLEKERMKYLLKTYFRLRIKKIETYFEYIKKNDLYKLLSKDEIEYLKKYD